MQGQGRRWKDGRWCKGSGRQWKGRVAFTDVDRARTDVLEQAARHLPAQMQKRQCLGYTDAATRPKPVSKGSVCLSVSYTDQMQCLSVCLYRVSVRAAREAHTVRANVLDGAPVHLPAVSNASSASSSMRLLLRTRPCGCRRRQNRVIGTAQSAERERTRIGQEQEPKTKSTQRAIAQELLRAHTPVAPWNRRAAGVSAPTQAHSLRVHGRLLPQEQLVQIVQSKTPPKTTRDSL